jgi:hypothetical protein
MARDAAVAAQTKKEDAAKTVGAAEASAQFDSAKADAKSKLDAAATTRRKPLPRQRRTHVGIASLRTFESLKTRAQVRLAFAEKALAAARTEEARTRAEEQRSPMQRNTVPGDALHVGHPGVVIHGRVVVLVLLDHRENASRRFAPRDPGGYGCTQDPTVGVVHGHLLALDRDDGHDRLACTARSCARF